MELILRTCRDRAPFPSEACEVYAPNAARPRQQEAEAVNAILMDWLVTQW